MKIKRNFVADGERYFFDFKVCTPDKGWAQIDTDQDAWYFGTWANPFELKIVNYCEGDITLKETDKVEEFVAEIRRLKEWNKNYGYTMMIDPMLNPKIEARFKEIGLGDLLH